MDFRELLALRSEIEALNAEFAYLIDHDQSELVADLFTIEGIYARSTGERSVGRDAIRAGYQKRKDKGPRTARHVFSNLRLTPREDGRVGGNCILTLFAEDGLPPRPANPLVVADYDDIYECCEDGRWRFAERTITWIFVREGASSPLQLGGVEGRR